jgi:hypothetical protein
LEGIGGGTGEETNLENYMGKNSEKILKENKNS